MLRVKNIIIAVLSLLVFVSTRAERLADHVVLIGLEGWGSFSINNIKNITGVRLGGAWTLEKVSVFPTNAAANYASMLTGVGTEFHGFYNDNSTVPDFTPAVKGDEGVFPTIFEAVRRQYPFVKTGCIYENPVVAGMITDRYAAKTPVPAIYRHTTKLGEMAAEYITANKPMLAAFMFEDPDYSGHIYGFGSDSYNKALTKVDECIGMIIQATKDAGIYDRTVFVIASTHGGRENTHGGRSVEEMETPLAIMGCNINKGKIDRVVTQLDIAPTIAHILDVKQPETWRGKPIEEILAGYKAPEVEPEVESLRFMSWNIMDGQWKTQGKNYDEFVEYIKKQDPDVCIFQEAQTIYETSDNINDTDNRSNMDVTDRYLAANWGELAARYGHKYWSIGIHRDNYPQVITSKYPIKKVPLDKMPADSIVYHGYGHFKVAVGNKLINFVTTHTVPTSYDPRVPREEREASTAANGGHIYRGQEMEYVCRHTIQRSANADNEYWLMCGDFNAPSSVDIELAQKNGGQWVYDYDTTHPQWLVNDYILKNTNYIDVVNMMHPNEFIISDSWKRRIDFVYCTPRLAAMVETADILNDFNNISDHRPVVVKFNLTK